MSMIRTLGLLAATFTLTSAMGAAVVDQQNLPTSAGLNSNLLNIEWQQEVKSGMSGRLVSLDLFYQAGVFAPAPAQVFRFFLNRGEGWQSDADEFSQLILAPTNGVITIDVSAARFNVGVGEKFMIGVEGLGPDGGCCNLQASMGDYLSGGLFLDFGSSGSELVGYDMAFVTRVDTAAVPLPSSAWLAALAMALLGLVRRHAQR